ncbi:MAG: ABC transporter permease [Chloroflexi bacterium]|nr:ABC transporter permease [Chloroflexota bacterium]
MTSAAAAAPSPARRHGRRDAWTHAWSVIRADRQSMLGMVILVVFAIIAIAGPILAGPIDRAGANRPMLDPSLAHLFGTDRSGRDLFLTNIWATQVSLLVGVVASILSMVIGTAMGIAAGYLGGRWDAWLMRLTDFFYVLPTLVLALVLAAIMGPSLSNVILVIAVTSWPATARVIRSQTLTVRERMFVDRARATGASSARIMRRQVLPNVFGLVLANTTLTIAGAIFLETTLSFLGVGPRDTYSWGRILDESFEAGALTLGKWAWFVPPGVAVVLVVLAFTLVGGAFDEILDPRLRRRGAGPGAEPDATDPGGPLLSIESLSVPESLDPERRGG